jgi:hypothetical protein
MKAQIKEGFHMALSILVIGAIILIGEYLVLVQMAEVVR